MSERGPEFGGMRPQEVASEAAEKRESSEYPSSEEVEEEMSLAMDGEEGIEVFRNVDDEGLRNWQLALTEKDGEYIHLYTYSRNGEDGKPSVTHEELFNDRPKTKSVVSSYENGSWNRK